MVQKVTKVAQIPVRQDPVETAKRLEALVDIYSQQGWELRGVAGQIVVGQEFPSVLQVVFVKDPRCDG